MISDFDLEQAQKNLHRMDAAQKAGVLALLEERDKLGRLAQARVEFLPFVKAVWPAFIPGAHHKLMAEKFERVADGTCKRLIINMAPRHCLAVDTPLLTPNGWTTMGEIQPGDQVYGPDGYPTMVVGKSEVHINHRCFKVTTKDGATLVADEGHLWSVGVDRKRPKVFKLRTTGNIFTRQTSLSEGRRPWVPDNCAVQYPPQAGPLPIAPYLFGMWVGNGQKSQSIITCDGRDLEPVRALIEADGDETTDQATYLTFGVLRTKVRLRALGVLNNKHIPQIYMRASVADRMRLLQGLFDSDGCAAKSGQLDISTSDPLLRDQYIELMRSLGINPHVFEYEAKIGEKSYGPAWRLYFYATDFGRAPRKRSRTLGVRRPVRRYISAEEHLTVPVQCIEVARPDGLFLAGRGLIVTHNTKSELASWLLPAWFIGRYPSKKIIQASATEDLAAGFGRKVRNLVGGEYDEDDENPGGMLYSEIFPKIKLSKDSKAAAGWGTNYGGVYFAIGVNGRVTGKGGDIVIIDDVHTEQEAKQAATNPAVFDAAYEWYRTGPRQRLQPGAAIIIVMTRWSRRDLTGRLLDKMKHLTDGEDGDRWEVLELPAILDEGTENERSMWPGYWPLQELKNTRADIGPVLFKAQYQQQPTSEEVAIIKRDSWRKWGDPTETCPGPEHLSAWEHGSPPACTYVLQSWDCAATKTNRSDYSAMTEWGVFEAEDPATGKTINNIILLNAYKARMEFPELKRKARMFYNETVPDTVLIENKNSGTQLIQEFRLMGMPVEDYSFGRGRKGASNDKIARANAIADVFASGYVWTPPMRYAEDVIEECAALGGGGHDDLADSTVQAMLRFRNGGFIRTANDQDDDDEEQTGYVRKRMY